MVAASKRTIAMTAMRSNNEKTECFVTGLAVLSGLLLKPLQGLLQG